MNETNPNLAFVFPGQGSQNIGMLAEIGAKHPRVRDTFAEASEVLGCDVWRLCQAGPEDRLNQTENTQPALLAAGVALWRLWVREGGARPALLAGHSLGEYTALVAAGSLDYPEAVRLVRTRAEQMQRAVPAGRGAMAAIIGLDDAAVETVCAQAAEGDVVSAANYNAPGQVVIAGAAPAVERAVTLAQELGARRAIQLPVSVPSHCELMRPAAAGLKPQLSASQLTAPAVTIVHNVDAQSHEDPAAIREALLRQLYCPVHWTRSVRRMADSGVTRIVECGPGKVLSGLIRRIDRNLKVSSLDGTAQFETALGDIGSWAAPPNRGSAIRD